MLHASFTLEAGPSLTAGNAAAAMVIALAIQSARHVLEEMRLAEDEEPETGQDETALHELEEARTQAWPITLSLQLVIACALVSLRWITTAPHRSQGACTSPDFWFWAEAATLLAFHCWWYALVLAVRGKPFGPRLVWRFCGGADLNWLVAAAAWITTVGGCLFVFTGLNYTAAFLPDAVLLRPEWSFHTARISYEKVEAIYHVKKVLLPNGQAMDWHRIVIDFAGSVRWTSEDGYRNTHLAADLAIAQAVSARSGVPVKEVDLLE